MHIVLHDSDKFILRFDKGEEVLAGLLGFAREKNITAAAFNGIGACNELEVGDFDLAAKTYRKHSIGENLEIVSLTGNISTLDGQPALHVHGSFGRPDLSTLSGHVFKLVVSVTCEIFLTKMEGGLRRGLDKDSGLNLLV